MSSAHPVEEGAPLAILEVQLDAGDLGDVVRGFGSLIQGCDKIRRIIKQSLNQVDRRGATLNKT